MYICIYVHYELVNFVDFLFHHYICIFHPRIYFERGPSFRPIIYSKIPEGLKKTEKDNKKELPFSGRIQSLVSEVF